MAAETPMFEQIVFELQTFGIRSIYLGHCAAAIGFALQKTLNFIFYVITRFLRIFLSS